MTIFLTVLAVLYVSHRARRWLREWYVPWYEQRLQERAEGLPRGSLNERWGTDGNGMSDEAWIDQLRGFNLTNHILKQR
jgi:hypothetical protein